MYLIIIWLYKVFHPSEEAAAVNWDNFLYYGSKEVENAANTQVLNQKLNALFNPVPDYLL